VAEVTNDLEAFKKELVELCLKHGFEIGGCGCCGSPWIEPVDASEYYPVPTVQWPKEVENKKPVTNTFGNTLGEFKF
jgi:hypothetical protein